MTKLSRLLAVLSAFTLLIVAVPAEIAEARGGYANWLKHGDIYLVDGKFGAHKQKFRVQVKWRGNRFVIQTPIGTFPLKRRGAGVSFRVKFQNAWARINWRRSRATVVYKKQRGSAKLRKIGNMSKPVRRVKTNLSNRG